MRISINLASRPFVEIRPLLARLRWLLGLLALLAVGLGLFLHSVSRHATAAQARLDSVHAQTLALQQQRAANEARMRQPVNRDVLDRSRFLNDVFARKSFSWTAIMMDLERVLPPGVQVTSIEPQLSKEGDVTIRLRVSGDRDRAVQLVRNLEHTARFLQPRLASESTQAAESASARQISLQSGTPALPGGVEFDILSGYNPLPEVGLTPVSHRGATSALAPNATAVPLGRPTVTSVPPSPAEQRAVDAHTSGRPPIVMERGIGAPPTVGAYGTHRSKRPSADPRFAAPAGSKSEVSK